jgi:anti-sigma factor RsiW
MDRKSCRDVIDILLDYVEGALTAEDRASVDAHLADCPPCIDFVRSYRETPRILRDVTARVMPDDVKQRLRAFLDEKGSGGQFGEERFS